MMMNTIKLFTIYRYKYIICSIFFTYKINNSNPEKNNDEFIYNSPSCKKYKQEDFLENSPCLGIKTPCFGKQEDDNIDDQFIYHSPSLKKKTITEQFTKKSEIDRNIESITKNNSIKKIKLNTLKAYNLEENFNNFEKNLPFSISKPLFIPDNTEKKENIKNKGNSFFFEKNLQETSIDKNQLFINSNNNQIKNQNTKNQDEELVLKTALSILQYSSIINFLYKDMIKKLELPEETKSSLFEEYKNNPNKLTEVIKNIEKYNNDPLIKDSIQIIQNYHLVIEDATLLKNNNENKTL